MYFLIAGIAFTLLKFLDIAPIASWPWWIVLSPYALAIAWWSLADSLGYTRKKEIDKENARVARRQEAQRAILGLKTTKSKKK